MPHVREEASAEVEIPEARKYWRAEARKSAESARPEKRLACQGGESRRDEASRYAEALGRKSCRAPREASEVPGRRGSAICRAEDAP